MKHIWIFALLFIVNVPQLEAAAAYVSSSSEIVTEEAISTNQRSTSFKERVKNIFVKQKAKLNKLKENVRTIMDEGPLLMKVGAVVVGVALVLNLAGVLTGVSMFLAGLGGHLLGLGLAFWLFNRNAKPNNS